MRLTKEQISEFRSATDKHIFGPAPLKQPIDFLDTIDALESEKADLLTVVVRKCDEIDQLNAEKDALTAENARLREAAIGEIHRHWLFLKHERDNGGNYEHMNTRMVEAEYLEGRLRALLDGKQAGDV